MTELPSSFAIVSLGCPKNLVDAEYICERLIAAGYSLKEESSATDLVIVNTCAFLTSSVEESIQTMLELVDEGKTVVCTGCLVSRYGAELTRELPEIRLFAGPGTYADLPQALQAGTGLIAPRFDSVVTRSFVSTGASAYVKVSEGCSNHCHYCLIPRLRGELVSKPLATVLQECRALVQQGVKELILIGQDLGSYGKDGGLENGLEQLLRTLADVPGVAWIRPLYIHPDAVTPALVKIIAGTPAICAYIDMPIQHVSEQVLTAMGRRGGAAAVRRALDLLRDSGIWIRTTLMVGHPGEDEAAFRELEDYVAQGYFDALGAFAFSPEPDTPSAVLPPVDEAEKTARLKRIMALQKKVSRKKLQSFRGRTLSVLLEGCHHETELLLRGRTAFQAPEIDGQVLINEGSAPFGSLVEVEIVDTLDYDLIGRIV